MASSVAATPRSEALFSRLQLCEDIELGVGWGSRIVLARSSQPTSLPTSSTTIPTPMVEYYAVKMVSKVHAVQENRVRMLLSEAQLLASLHHPNIITLHATYQTDAMLYFVFEYADGGDLATLLRRLPPSPTTPGRSGLDARTLRCLTRDLVGALEYLHCVAHVVHRDLKLENIMYRRVHVHDLQGQGQGQGQSQSSSQGTFYQLKVIDFGTAILSSELPQPLPKASALLPSNQCLSSSSSSSSTSTSRQSPPPHPRRRRCVSSSKPKGAPSSPPPPAGTSLAFAPFSLGCNDCDESHDENEDDEAEDEKEEEEETLDEAADAVRRQVHAATLDSEHDLRREPDPQRQGQGQGQGQRRGVGLVGSPAYLTPEMLLQSSATFSSDLWALGVVVYRCFSGVFPFEPEADADAAVAAGDDDDRGEDASSSTPFSEFRQFQAILAGSGALSVTHNALRPFPTVDGDVEDVDLEVGKVVHEFCRALLRASPVDRLGVHPVTRSPDYDTLKAHTLFALVSRNVLENEKDNVVHNHQQQPQQPQLRLPWLEPRIACREGPPPPPP